MSNMLADLKRLIRTSVLYMNNLERVNKLVLHVKCNVENLKAWPEESGKVIIQFDGYLFIYVEKKNV